MASMHWSTKGPPMSRQFCTPCTQISLTSAGQAEHTDSASVLSPQALTANPNPSINPRMIFVWPIALLPLGLVEDSEPHTRGDANGSQAFSDDSSLQSTRLKSPGWCARSAGCERADMENSATHGRPASHRSKETARCHVDSHRLAKERSSPKPLPFREQPHKRVSTSHRWGHRHQLRLRIGLPRCEPTPLWLRRVWRHCGICATV